MNSDKSRPPFGGSLRKNIYVIDMGWHRWSNPTRVRWLKRLRAGLMEDTIPRINAEIRRLGG